MTNHKDFYAFAKYYDIAFDFKDVAKECDFMAERYKAAFGQPPNSFLELAAGPGLHGVEFAQKGLHSVALDLSPEMVEYGLSKAKSEGVELEYFCGDMIDFDLQQKFDLVAILMDSTSYLLDNDSVISHLDSVANHLNDKGLYILEMGHPRDIFNAGTSAETDWTMKKDEVEVKVQWGAKGDPFDPISQISQTTVKMNVTDGKQTEELVETAPQRCFSANEFYALVRASGKLKVLETFGAMNSNIPFSNDKQAWRMVSVLTHR